MDWVYSDVVKDHFMNPRNVLQKDEDFQEDGKGLTGNVKCGDQMLMLIQVDDEERIRETRWQTYGCASAIASTSILSEVVKGMKVEDAFNITPKDITERLGGLPENKIHCSVLGDKALREAINDYFRRSGQESRVREEKAAIVCQCMNVTDHEIEDAVLEGARTYLELQEHTKLGTVCGQCKPEAEKLLTQYIEKHFK
jgi:nitrogen fixation NifU-like protein